MKRTAKLGFLIAMSAALIISAQAQPQPQAPQGPQGRPGAGGGGRGNDARAGEGYVNFGFEANRPGRRSPGQDDSVWINQGIKNAIAAAQVSYTIPAGTYILQNPILIPEGTKNFTVTGAGMNDTIITAGVVMPYMIVGGYSIVNTNNWGLTNRVNHKLQSVNSNTKSIFLSPGEPAPTVNARYVLYDDANVVHRLNNSWTSRYRTEIVRVTAYDPVSQQITLESTTGRAYSVNPKLANINTQMSQNVTVQNLGLNGYVTDTTACDGLLCYATGFQINIKNIRARKFKLHAITLLNCRTSTVDGVDVAEATSFGDGEGYGVLVSRSRTITVKNSTAANCRHGFVMHTGSMDVQFDNCTIPSGGGIDTHGYDERRLTVTNCNVPRINLGNTSWLGGIITANISNTTIRSNVYLFPNATNVTFTSCNIGTESTASTIILEGVSGTTGTPSSGNPGTVTFNLSTIAADQSLLKNQGTQTFGKLTFTNSTLNSRLASGSVINMQVGTGTIDFQGGTINCAANFTIPVTLASGAGRTLNVTFNGTKIMSTQAANAITIPAAHAGGSITMTNNEFYAPNASSANFANIAAGVAATQSNNQVFDSN